MCSTPNASVYLAAPSASFSLAGMSNRSKQSLRSILACRTHGGSAARCVAQELATCPG
jgi:hypothetical protein